MSMVDIVKKAVDLVQPKIAKSRFASKCYIECLSMLSRNVFPSQWTSFVQNGVLGRGVVWPKLLFGPRSVRIGATTINLRPHLGEFDQQALFAKKMDYEAEVVAWLAKHISAFDTVIEIGANVGVHSLLMASMLASKSSARIYCFEPACEAAMRFRENAISNPGLKLTLFEMAVGLDGGFVEFHSPVGHLTNGSLRREFASIFSKQVQSNLVPSLAASQLQSLFSGRVLVKMDVEGLEPELLEAMTPLLKDRKPHVIMEVLPGTDDYLNQCQLRCDYDFFHLSSRGATKSERVLAHPSERDWLLVPRA